jgi:hypothetical protein
MPDELLQSTLHHTAFLDYDAPLGTRVSYLLSNILCQKGCRQCGKLLRITVALKNAPEFCSLKCSNSSAYIKEKKRIVSLEKYGTENPAQHEDVKQKIKDTIFDRYGVENISKLDEIKKTISKKNKLNFGERLKKIRKTSREKYGVSHYSSAKEVKEKKKKTSLKKYGVEHYFQTDEFRDNFKRICMDKYVVDNPSKAPQIIQKIADTKQARYGDAVYNNRPKALSTMQSLFDGRLASQRHWSQETFDILQSFEKLSEIAKAKTIYEMAKYLGVAPTTMYYKLEQCGLFDYKGKRTNQYEYLIEVFLTELGVKFDKNTRTVLKNGQELDFYLPEFKIGIECNGIFWHSELMGKDKHYHIKKTQLATDLGIQLIHFWDYQFNRHSDLIRSIITHKLSMTPRKVMARKTVVRELAPKEYTEFLDENHIQGNVNSSIRYGLFNGTECVAVMGFGKSRFEKSEVELHRYCVKKYTSVPGGAGKLLAHFCKNNANIKKIISYASRDRGDGELYRSLGFTLVSMSGPGYHYFDKHGNIFNRMKFQKHRLDGTLKDFNKDLTEWENMVNHGYNRFWDTGNCKYELTV